MSSEATAPQVKVDELTELVVTRWIDLGVTSRGHPVLQYALSQIIFPFGLVCSHLEFEPFSAIEAGSGGMFFHKPRFDPARVTHPDLVEIIRRYPTLRADEVTISGHIFFSAQVTERDQPQLDRDIDTLAATCIAQVQFARRFLLTAALSLVREGDVPLKQQFLSERYNDFCEAILARMQS